MFNKLGYQQRSFLDSILTVLTSNPVFNNEDCVYKKVCFEENIQVFNTVKIPFDEFKKFLPKGSELLYFRLATRYLEDNKLIISNNLGGDKYQYIITYQGLLLSKNGGLKKEHSSKNLKYFLQNAVWIVTLSAFLCTAISYLVNIYYEQDKSQRLYKIEKTNHIQTQKLRELQQRTQQLEKTTLKTQEFPK